MWANRLIPVGHPKAQSVPVALMRESCDCAAYTHTSLSPPSPWSVISDPVRPWREDRWPQPCGVPESKWARQT